MNIQNVGFNVVVYGLIHTELGNWTILWYSKFQNVGRIKKIEMMVIVYCYLWIDLSMWNSGIGYFRGHKFYLYIKFLFMQWFTLKSITGYYGGSWF